MSAELLPDQTTPLGLGEGIILVQRAQDSRDWKPVVDWLAQHPECAEEIARVMNLEARLNKQLPPAQSFSNPPGTGLGPFELIERLGGGAMGDVYRARERVGAREVAVKVVRIAGLSAAELARARFEVQAMAELRHPNIVPLFTPGETDGELYFAMPLMTAGTLEKYRKAQPDEWLMEKEAARLVREVALGVHHAHLRGLIHRDLKPANILLDADRKPHVADFGLARRTDELLTTVAGSPAYMSPEQARGERHLTPASDVHALGAILFELLTGKTPFGGKDVASVLRSVIEDPAPRPRALRPDVSRDLQAICLKCLEKRPENRYASAQELADDLDRFVDNKPVKARPPGLWGSVVREVLRTQFGNPVAWGWISLLNGLVGLALYLFLAWAISAQLPREYIAPAGPLALLAVGAGFWAFLRNRQFRAGDRHSLAVWIGVIVATTLLPVVYRPTEGGDLTAYRLSLYPLLALFMGAGYFALAGPFWGGFYLLGAGHFGLALVMTVFPAAGPVVYAIVHSVTNVLVGVYLIRAGRSPDTSP